MAVMFPTLNQMELHCSCTQLQASAPRSKLASGPRLGPLTESLQLLVTSFSPFFFNSLAQIGRVRGGVVRRDGGGKSVTAIKDFWGENGFHIYISKVSHSSLDKWYRVFFFPLGGETESEVPLRCLVAKCMCGLEDFFQELGSVIQYAEYLFIALVE